MDLHEIFGIGPEYWTDENWLTTYPTIAIPNPLTTPNLLT